jgi:hypothetical protein
MPLQLGDDAHVEDAQASADGAGDGVRRGAPGAEAPDHRRRDLFGPGRDAASEDAVIARADHHSRVFGDRRRDLSNHPRELCS